MITFDRIMYFKRAKDDFFRLPIEQRAVLLAFYGACGWEEGLHLTPQEQGRKLFTLLYDTPHAEVLIDRINYLLKGQG